jgi:hypothetical protein
MSDGPSGSENETVGYRAKLFKQEAADTRAESAAHNSGTPTAAAEYSAHLNEALAYKASESTKARKVIVAAQAEKRAQIWANLKK